jgi:hypothetical protein
MISKVQHGTEETIDDRIKRIARTALSCMTLDRDRLLGFRNYLWDMSDYLGACGDNLDRELKKKRRANPKWKRDRPKPSAIGELETGLKSFIGRDLEKLELVEQILSWIQPVISNPTMAPQVVEQASDSLDVKKVRKIVRVLTRGKSGRPPTSDDVKARAYAMQREGKTIGQIAHALWPDAYKENPAQARERMKSTLYRYKQRMQQQASAKHKTRDKN